VEILPIPLLARCIELLNDIAVGIDMVKNNKHSIQRLVIRANRVLVTLNELIRKETSKLEDVKHVEVADLPLPDHIKSNLEALLAYVHSTMLAYTICALTK
jgi:hypothetical protein